MNTPLPMFVWKGRYTRVIDGDTIEVELDTGFHTVHTERVRLIGVDTPEPKGLTYDAGIAAKEYVKNVLDQLVIVANEQNLKWTLVVQTYKTDSFGRYLADIWSANNMWLGNINNVIQNVSLSQLLILEGYGIKR